MVNINELHISSTPRLIFMANTIANKGRSNKSYSIQIVNNGHNDGMLSNLFSSQNNRAIRFEARYTIQAVTMIGYLLITSIDKRKAEAVFITGNGSLWEALQDKSLRDYDWSEWSHVLNKTNVDASESSGDYTYDLSDRGAFKNEDNPEFNRTAVDIAERYPAFNVINMIDKLLESEGYSMAVRIDPIEDWRLMYMQDNAIRNSKEWEKDALAEWVIESNIDTYTDIIGDGTYQDVDWLYQFDTAETFDNDGNFNALGFYDVPETGTYRFYVDIQDLTLAIEDDNGNPVTVRDEDLTAGKLTVKWMFYDANTSTEIYSYKENLTVLSVHDRIIDTRYVELTTGTRIAVYLHITGEALVTTGRTSAFAATITDSSVKMDVSRYYGSGSTVDPAVLMPDMSALSFMSKVFNYLNIYAFYQHETKRLLLYRRTDDVARLNITPVEVNEPVEEKKNYWFRFSTDKAAPPEDLYFDLGNDINDEIKLEFSRTLINDSFRVFGSTRVLIPVMWDSTDKDPTKWQYRNDPPAWKTKGNLRILRYDGLVDATGLGGGNYLVYGGVNDTNYSAPKFFPSFSEVDVREYYRYDLSLQGVTLECTAKIKDLWNLYNQDYFKHPVQVVGYGKYWIEEAEQINGDLFKLTLIK